MTQSSPGRSESLPTLGLSPGMSWLALQGRARRSGAAVDQIRRPEVLRCRVVMPAPHWVVFAHLGLLPSDKPSATTFPLHSTSQTSARSRMTRKCLRLQRKTAASQRIVKVAPAFGCHQGPTPPASSRDVTVSSRKHNGEGGYGSHLAHS